jgi:DNA-binding NtrC family response regulator
MQMPPLRERGEDIVLLFRLFAMQMAQEYKMDRIVLTDEAKQMLMRYKWPGNVRQLKNITRQISVLSTERTITPEILAKFIPQDRESTQLTVINKGGDHSFENEREILYKILFELRGNVNDMRREIGMLKKQIDDVQSQPTTIIGTTTTQSQAIPTIQTMPTRPAVEDAVAEEYVEPATEQENLNLNDLSRQMLVKALERNNGNRSKAAQELGISDRTLYRRLKQYGLDK